MNNQHWWEKAIFYHYYPFGAFGAPNKNDSFFLGENKLSKLIEWIPYLVDLGITAIYFGPLFESTTHGYDTKDFFEVDRRLGNNDHLKECIKKLKQNNIKIIFDGVFNHVGRDFWAFQDVRTNLSNSKYCDWFSNLNFNGSLNSYGDPFTYEGWEGHYDLVKLNMANSEVKKHLFSAIQFWINEFNIDGLRLDVAYCLDRSFLRELSQVCKNQDSNFWLMGEMIHGDYREIMDSELLDSVTNYECYKGLYSSHVDLNYFEIAYSYDRLFGNNGIYKDYYLYNFADNHDVSRVSSSLSDKRHLYPLYILLFTMPGIPSIYYGSEWGVEGIRNNGNDSDLRPYIDFNNFQQWCKHPSLFETIKQLIKIKKENEEFSFGNYEQLYLNHQQFAFTRSSNNSKSIILVNSESNVKDLIINLPQNLEGKFIDLLSNEKFNSHNSKLHLKLWPNWGRILKQIY